MIDVPPLTGNAISPSAWVLAAPGAGDNQQLRALVRLLGARTRWIEPGHSIWRVLQDRLARNRCRPMPVQEPFVPPWPDLVITAGGRSVVDAVRIREASGERSRVVCIGRPWAPLDWFDLVITTPQYGLPERANVMCIDLPLNLPEPVAADELQRWRARFEDLPRPLIGTLVGGHSGSYRFPNSCADRLAGTLNELTELSGGSAVVVSSPRTPDAALTRMQQRLSSRVQVFGWPGSEGNPFASLLELADALLVTSDSASMLANACFSGKPAAVFPMREKLHARLARRLTLQTSFNLKLRRRLIEQGLWIPARDMPRLLQRLADSGRTVAVERLLDDQHSPRPDPASTESEIVRRIERLVDARH